MTQTLAGCLRSHRSNQQAHGQNEQESSSLGVEPGFGHWWSGGWKGGAMMIMTKFFKISNQY
jgi:hypothetical protein